MMTDFRVALSADFIDEEGQPRYPDFDLSAFQKEPGLQYNHVVMGEEIDGSMIDDFDALVVLLPRFSRGSVPQGGRLKVVSLFGVGYDTVDLKKCTEHGIVLTNTPDAVRRPVAVAILSLMLALTEKVFTKDRITRQSNWGERSSHMGVGLIGKTLGSLGFGSIAGEMFRLAAGFNIRFLTNDPFVAPEVNVDVQVEKLGL